MPDFFIWKIFFLKVGNKIYRNKKGPWKTSKTLVMSMVAGEGFEPTTFGL